MGMRTLSDITIKPPMFGTMNRSTSYGKTDALMFLIRHSATPEQRSESIGLKDVRFPRKSIKTNSLHITNSALHANKE